MLRRLFVCLAILGLSAVANAQGTGFGTGTGTAIGGNTGGGGVSGGLFNQGGGGGGGGQADLFQSNVQQGLSGQRGGANQNSGFLGQRGDQQQGATGGFLGGGREVGQQQNAGRGNQFGNFNFGGGGRGGAGAGRQPQQQRGNTSRTIRFKLTLPKDFNPVVIPVTQVQSSLNNQFQRVRNLRPRTLSSNASTLDLISLRGSQISATTTGRIATLTGTVRTIRDRELAERIAKMEPGIDGVVNQLTVASTP